MKKIFIDTMIFRYAASVKVIQTAKLQNGVIKSKNGREKEAKFLIHESVVKPPTTPDDKELSENITAIKNIAKLAHNNKILLQYSHEVNLELLFHPQVDIVPGRLHGAPCKRIHSPLLKIDKASFRENDLSQYPYSSWPKSKYGRGDDLFSNVEDFTRDKLFSIPTGCFDARISFHYLITSLREKNNLKANAAELLLPMLQEIKDERYLDILKCLNYLCVGEKKRSNLYLDAYHLWTAEKARCDYFLTTDRPILNQYSHTLLKANSPKQLLEVCAY